MKEALLKAGFKKVNSQAECLGSKDKAKALPIVNDIAYFAKVFNQ